MEPYTLIEGPEAWYSTEYLQGPKKDSWVHQLSPAEVSELDNALQQLIASGLVKHEGNLLKLVRGRAMLQSHIGDQVTVVATAYHPTMAVNMLPSS